MIKLNLQTKHPNNVLIYEVYGIECSYCNEYKCLKCHHVYNPIIKKCQTSCPNGFEEIDRECLK